MGESIWCNITVRMPAAWGDDPVKIPGCDLLADYLTETDAELVTDAIVTTWTFAGDGNYGLSADPIAEALAWFEEHGVPYHASSDPKYEYEGETVVFDGASLHLRASDGDGGITLHEHRYRQIVAEWAHAPAGVLTAIEDWFKGLPDISKIDLSHLPAICPGTENDEIPCGSCGYPLTDGRCENPLCLLFRNEE